MFIHGRKENRFNYESVKLKILVVLLELVFVRLPHIISKEKCFNCACRWCGRVYVSLRMNMAKIGKDLYDL